ncbi:MAG: hypothetical protein SO232_03335 [Candidatus Onthovivens sp.]|nr:hypothetical protein [Candidatus Onthovivens sp.]
MKKIVLFSVLLLALTSCGNNPTDEFITAINDQHEKGKFFQNYDYYRKSSFINEEDNKIYITTYNAKIFKEDGIWDYDLKHLKGDLMDVEVNRFYFEKNELVYKENIIYKFKDKTNYFNLTKIDNNGDIVYQEESSFKANSPRYIYTSIDTFFFSVPNNVISGLELFLIYNSIDINYFEPNNIVVNFDNKDVYTNKDILDQNNNLISTFYYKKSSDGISKFYFDDELRMTKIISLANNTYIFKDDVTNIYNHQFNGTVYEELNSIDSFEVII